MSSAATARSLLPARLPTGALLDVAITAVTLAGSLALLSHGGIEAVRTGAEVDAARDGRLGLVSIVLAACSTVPLLAWRRFPLGVFAATAVASVLLAGAGYALDLTLGAAAALYLLAASRTRDAPWTRLHTVTAAGLLVAFLAATAAAQGTLPGVELLHTGLAWAVAWFAGERTRLRREQIADLRRRALRTERDAERERLLATAEERARIARDLHDSAGHAISVIAVRAGAARLRHEQDPGRSLQTLEAIEELARQTVEEIDHIVGTLRGGGRPSEDVETPAGLGSLDTLIANHTAAGLEVTLSASGTPQRLDGVADQAAYRILQEALTNAARHGAGSARIALAFSEAAIELTVTNPAHDSGASRSRGGHGLIGMQERATMLGGSLDVERSNGTFSLRARIPYGGRRQ